MYAVFEENNYLSIHLIIEIFIIVMSFTIAIQAWLIVPYILSNRRMYIGALFLFLGILEIVHAVSYTGMPFFIHESSTYSTSWFYMIARVSQALGLLLIFTSKPKKVPFMQRGLVYSLAFLLALIWTIIIYYPSHLLPNLVIEGVGTTALKYGIQYLAIVLQFLLVLYLLKNFKSSPTQNALIIMASIYLIISDSMFATYKTVYDIRVFVGHLLQLLGSYFLVKTLYYSSVQKPFEKLIATKKQLEKSKESLQHIAYHDELTGLPNARFLKEKLTEELKIPKTKKAIMMIEIDQLKSINETLGYSFGDVLLQQVSIRLRESLPKELFISKMNEGEFSVLLHAKEDTDGIINVCTQIKEVMKEPFHLQHFLFTVTLNIGICVCPSHRESVNNLLKHAQIAMREAQKGTKDYLFYRSEMKKRLEKQLLLKHDLHHALEKGEFHLEYQPQVDVKSGRINSVEALIRWKHPKKGWISPATFIPIAEEIGLIVPIGEWVLETACRQVKKWHDDGICTIGVAVNLSIRQFFQQNLVQIVEGILIKTNFPPHYLELEITESMTIDTSHTIKILHDLKRLGVTIAVDDFGTGYSSLSYLKDFPIDCLKIDRSFVRNVKSHSLDDAIISMIIAMAKHLELKVIAEGVEELEQLAFLDARDCDSIQGYLFSKPIPPEELSAKFDEIQQQILSITRVN